MRATLAPLILFSLAACDPVVFSNAGKYEISSVALLDESGNALGMLSAFEAPGTSVTVEASIELHLFGDYNLVETVVLVATPPIGPSVTMRMPFNESGEWEELSDTEVQLTSSEGKVTKMTLEKEDGSKIAQTIPSANFGVFPPPFSWLNGKKLHIRMAKLPEMMK